MSAAELIISIRNAYRDGRFLGYKVPYGQEISVLTLEYANAHGLVAESLAFHELLTKEEARSVGKNALDKAAPRIGTELDSLDNWTKDTIVLAYGEPLGKSPVRESSLVSFRLFSLLSTATHFIRSLLFALL
jgi:hypothetical protein